MTATTPPTSRPRPVPLRRFLAVVATVGCAPLAELALGDRFGAVLDAPPLFFLLAAFIVVGELLPIKLPGHDDEFTTSTPFTYALLLTCGLAPAALAQAFASVVADLRKGKAPLSVAFNAGQLTLALLGSALVLDMLVGLPRGGVDTAVTVAMLPALMVAGAAFFTVNNVLAGAAAALAQGVSIVPFLRADLGYQAWMALIVVGFAPLIIAVADHALFLVPLLGLPLVAIHRGSRAARLSEHRALHDGLTELPNRTRFRAFAEHSIVAARREGRSVGVLVIDLDRFKEINDTLGHHHGDLLLREIGPRLREALDAQAMVARFGGDEFAVLLPASMGVTEAEGVARTLLVALERPFMVDGMTLDVGASIGIACFPEHGDTIETLLQHGDIAMYAAKAAHLGFAVYSSGQHEHTLELDRLALAGQLRQALERDELVMHYQPKVDLGTGRISGAEALMRWQHPGKGLLYPDAFVPLAEHTGLIRSLTMHALRLAIAQAAAWRRTGLDLAVSVNVTSRDLLDQRLPREVDELLAAHDVPASALEIEITESTLMDDPHRAHQVLQELHARGVRVAVDDFGTGYSSLAYLKRLPIDAIKIDKSFVLNMSIDRNDAVIVASTIDLGRSLGLRTVAEGVEDATACAELSRMGCDVAQGYYWSRPVPPDELARWTQARALEAADAGAIGVALLAAGEPQPA